MERFIINNFTPKQAVCPFCKNFIEPNAKILKDINLTDGKLLADVLKNRINYITCNRCNESFFYEWDCGVINTRKNYAVASLPSGNSLPKEKSCFLNILKKDGFKLRIVKEFIYLAEKVRFFEFGLDDRVMEIIKYKFVCLPNNLSTNAKIILTDVDGNALVYTVFNEFDKPLATHRVCSDTYHEISRKLPSEKTDLPLYTWKEIDLNWAKQYEKEKKK